MCVNWNSSINSNFLDCRPNILSDPFFVTSVHANHWNHYPLIEARSNRYTMFLSVSHRRASNQLSVINKIDISLLYFLLCYIYFFIFFFVAILYFFIFFFFAILYFFIFFFATLYSSLFSSSLLYYTSLFLSSLLHYTFYQHIPLFLILFNSPSVVFSFTFSALLI